MNLKKFIKCKLNNLFYREYILKRKTDKYLAPFYNREAQIASNVDKQIIVMVDGRKTHGGLVDRLRGIITTYKYCLEHQIDFRIHFTSPFRLEDLLIPNEYNWCISDEDISYNSNCSLPVYINSSRYGGDAELVYQQKLAEKYFRKEYKQIHVYTNMYYADKEFGGLFNSLFKPVPKLQEWVNEQSESIGGNYIAVATRFQNLLGDFKDGASQALSLEEQEALIKKCINQIMMLQQNHSDIKKILITSDSAKFLKEVSKLDFVYVLPGEIGHMDTKSEDDISIHMKTFLDFFMLAKSQKIYLLIIGKMYKSGFSNRAAKLSGIPFVEIIS